MMEIKNQKKTLVFPWSVLDKLISHAYKVDIEQKSRQQ